MSKTHRPRPGSLAYRVLTFLTLNPGEELTRDDIAVKFDVIHMSVDSGLSTMVQQEILVRERNEELEHIWKLGSNTDFVLDQVSAVDEFATPARTPSSIFPGVSPVSVPELNLNTLSIQKNTPLMTKEERRRAEFSAWFDKFEVRDSAEFDDVHLPTIRTEMNRHAKAKGTKWKIAQVTKARSGVERVA